MAGKRIEVGDVVRLKSGSVAMTVTNVDGDGVNCVYYDTKTNEPKYMMVPTAAVKLDED